MNFVDEIKNYTIDELELIISTQKDLYTEEEMGQLKALLEEKLKILQIDPSSISAILVTHEHVDHCKGIGVFARKYKTKI